MDFPRNCLRHPCAVGGNDLAAPARDCSSCGWGGAAAAGSVSRLAGAVTDLPKALARCLRGRVLHLEARAKRSRDTLPCDCFSYSLGTEVPTQKVNLRASWICRARFTVLKIWPSPGSPTWESGGP
jgi:hypothetical protein